MHMVSISHIHALGDELVRVRACMCVEEASVLLRDLEAFHSLGCQGSSCSNTFLQIWDTIVSDNRTSRDYT